MTKKRKIGIVGDKESVFGFMAVGFGVFAVHSPEEAENAIKNAFADGYAVLYVTEDILEKLPNVYEKYKSDPETALIPLPSKNGTTGFGMANIRHSVERAVGADIFKEQ